jgi:hypothetical protein
MRVELLGAAVSTSCTSRLTDENGTFARSPVAVPKRPDRYAAAAVLDAGEKACSDSPPVQLAQLVRSAREARFSAMDHCHVVIARPVGQCMRGKEIVLPSLRSPKLVFQQRACLGVQTWSVRRGCGSLPLSKRPVTQLLRHALENARTGFVGADKSKSGPETSIPHHLGRRFCT